MSMGPLGRITEETTMGELAMLRAQYGVTRMHTASRYVNGREQVTVTLVTENHTAVGTSADNGKNIPLIAAMADAYARLIHVLGATITTEGIQSGESVKWQL